LQNKRLSKQKVLLQKAKNESKLIKSMHFFTPNFFEEKTFFFTKCIEKQQQHALESAVIKKE